MKFWPPEDCQLGDVGKVLTVTIVNGDDPVDISGAAALSIRVHKPDESTVDFEAALSTDGTDGQLQYTTATDDLDQVGRWQVQGRAQGAGSPPEWDRYSPVTGFTVHPNVEPSGSP